MSCNNKAIVFNTVVNNNKPGNRHEYNSGHNYNIGCEYSFEHEYDSGHKYNIGHVYDSGDKYSIRHKYDTKLPSKTTQIAHTSWDIVDLVTRNSRIMPG
ncbi:12352_t:CDS:2 [Racocetra persica]|uniref:12352_t:CDS:1 n=1 Tax=Racocetra persica TaxID=160502 RepID=A0ACA9R9G5_9GLOM|nr:12352_t:CDS:2 [Racocetra persica]